MENLYMLIMRDCFGYKPNDRTFSDIKCIVDASEDYSRFSFKAEKGDDVVYSGAEHLPDDLSKKLPNLTCFLNLETEEGVTVMGSSMGHHQHMEGGKRMQEIYEYHGFGAMVIDHDGGDVDFIIAQPGDKIAVPNQCHMTLYNLDSVPLVTSDFANPDKGSDDYNGANKVMQNEIGPIFCVYQIGGEVFIQLNNQYVNSGNTTAADYGSGLAIDDTGIGLKLPFDVGTSDGLGERLYEKLERSRYLFKKIGVTLRPASEVEINGLDRSQSLFDIIASKDRPLQKHFSIEVKDES